MTMEDLPLRRGPGRPPKTADADNVSVKQPDIVAEKVSLAEIGSQTVGAWLLQRLHERWPHHGDGSRLALMRSWLFANDMSFMVALTGPDSGAVGLATIVHEPLAVRPTIREIFMFLKERGQATESERCGAAIYRHWKRWGKGLGAAELRVGGGSDVTLGRLKELLAGETRSQIFVDLLR